MCGILPFVGVPSDPPQKFYVALPLLCEKFGGKGGFLGDEAGVEQLVFGADTVVGDDGLDFAMARVEGGEFWVWGVGGGAVGGGVVVAEVGELGGQGCTFMRWILSVRM
jgi:hypothetical protein